MGEPRVLTVGCLLVQYDGLEAVRRQVLRMLPAVDRYVVVDSGSEDGTNEWLAALRRDTPGLHVVNRVWNDSFADARNSYLAVVSDIAREWDGDAVFVASPDVDELFSDELLADLRRKIAPWAYLEDFNVVKPFSASVETDWKGDVVWERRDGYAKPIMLVYEPGSPGTHYEDRFGHFHEDLKQPSGWRGAELDDEGGRYVYRHTKPHGIVWVRGLRNFFAGGGGPCLGERNPLWMPLRALAREAAGVETSDQFLKYLKAGGIDGRVKDFFIERRLLGTRFDPTPPMWAEWPDGTSEVREGFLTYFVWFHPEEMPDGLPEADRAYMDYAGSARTIHGPRAPAWAAER